MKNKKEEKAEAKANAKANQQRWKKNHKDRIETRNMKAKQGNRCR